MTNRNVPLNSVLRIIVHTYPVSKQPAQLSFINDIEFIITTDNSKTIITITTTKQLHFSKKRVANREKCPRHTNQPSQLDCQSTWYEYERVRTHKHFIFTALQHLNSHIEEFPFKWDDDTHPIPLYPKHYVCF